MSDRRAAPSPSRIQKHSGGVIIEFTMILPIIIFFALGIIEFTRVIQHYKIALSLSREAANLIFRECSDPDFETRRTCLDELRNKIETFGDNLANGTAIIVSIYEFEGAIPAPPAIRKHIQGERAGFPSRFGPPGSGEPYTLPDELAPHVLVIVGEAYVPYKPIITFIASLFNYIPENGAFYDATII